MHIVIRRYKLELDAVEAVTRVVREGFAPYISRVMPGFVEYYWIDAGDGDLISLSIFEDPVVASASTQVAEGYIERHLSDLVRDPPEVIEGEVILRVVGRPGKSST